MLRTTLDPDTWTSSSSSSDGENDLESSNQHQLHHPLIVIDNNNNNDDFSSSSFSGDSFSPQQDRVLPGEEDDGPDPVAVAKHQSIWDIVLFNRVLPVLKKGYRTPLQAHHLPPAPADCVAETIASSFEKLWEQEMNDKKTKYRQKHHTDDETDESWKHSVGVFSLFKVMTLLSKKNVILAALFGVINLFFSFGGPLLLSGLLNELNSIDDDQGTGSYQVCALYCDTIIFFYFAKCLSWAHVDNHLRIFGLKNDACVTSAVLTKSLTIGKQADKGNITTLMSVDAGRLDYMAWHISMLWYSPTTVFLAFLMLFYFVGISALSTVIVAAFLVPMNGFVIKKFNEIQEAMMELEDKRVKMVGEFLQGILTIKLFGWEPMVIKRIGDIRDKQLGKLFTYSILLAMVYFFYLATTGVLTAAIFLMYSLLGNEMSPQVIFPVIQLIAGTSWALFDVPDSIAAVSEGMTSSRRVTQFLLNTELRNHKLSFSDFAKSSSPPVPSKTTDDIDNRDVAISMENGNFQWPKATRQTLKQLSFKIKRGELVAIVGEVGCGKTSLLSSLIGEIPSTSDLQLKNYHQFELLDPESDSDSDGEKEEKDEKEDYDESESESESDSEDDEEKNLIKKADSSSPSSSSSSSSSSSVENENKPSEEEEKFFEKPLIYVNGSVAYVPQEAWIKNASLKENIINNQVESKKQYRKTLKVCALEPDLVTLPAGDKTEIGERGINLSGGQKQRVNLARAVYSNRDILLLDDPLSAVDAHVGKFLFEECICKALAHTTRVLVTHQLQFLPFVDRIFVMKDGEITHSGSFEQLTQENVNFTSLVSSVASEPLAPSSSDIKKSTNDDNDDLKNSLNQSIDDSEKLSSSKDEGKSGKLIDEEERDVGSVKMDVYQSYFTQIGGAIVVILLIAICTSSEATDIFNNYWLSYWSGHFETISNNLGLSVFIISGIVSAFIVLIRQLVWSVATWRASREMHLNMVHAVFHSPLSFFHSTPQGRILNRFSKDQDAVDTSLPETTNDFLICMFYSVSKAILVTIAIPLFFVFFIPIMIVFYFLIQFFRASSRELKRLESIAESPLYAHFDEVLNGLDTIRAYGQQTDAKEKNLKVMNNYLKIYIASFVSGEWLDVANGLLSSATLIVVMTMVLMLTYFQYTTVALAGLAIVSAMGITDSFGWMVSSSTQLEAEMSHVQRIMTYSKLAPEASHQVASPPLPPPVGWPSRGQIEFKDVVVKYRPDLDPALDGVSFRIEAGEKVGVVGRTGAGKSSMTMALFRIIDCSQGSIVIDGVDTSRISLHDLRHQLSIIPQDATLFSGTVRSNLDPENEHTDPIIWHVLRSVNMSDVIHRLSGKLDFSISENGKNFSSGQRQLLCLARALLRKGKILVMDEATASVDPETDEILQKTIRTECQGQTVITIAHRLPTIIDYDKVLVLDKGRVSQFGSPHELLQQEGIFQELVDHTGPLASGFLRSAAAKAHSLKHGQQEQRQ